MRKQQFYELEKEQIKTKYAALRKSMNRTDAINILVNEYEYSTFTIGQILYNPKYRNSSKNSKVKTVPKSE